MTTCTICNCEYNDGSCECAPPECDHAWFFVEDWEGDPNVINGTHDTSRFECENCDEIRNPDDYRMRDYVRSRREEKWLSERDTI